MGAFSVSMEGFERFRKRIEKYKTGVEKEIKRVIYTGALAIHEDAVKAIERGSKSGIIYPAYTDKEGNKHKKHQASAPGEAPATDTGHLVGSSNPPVTVTDEGHTVEVRFRQKYALWLEFGTVNMAPRPFLGPAYQKNLPVILINYKKALLWKDKT